MRVIGDLTTAQHSPAVFLIERIHQMIAERCPAFGPLSHEIYDLLIKLAEPQLQGMTTLPCIILNALS
jgi:hypothetical protein